ncbi:MAG: L-lysine 6-transaminase, partial [Melioribacteraceae bacterium]
EITTIDKDVLTNISANEVHNTLNKWMLVDGFDVVLDTIKSHGLWMVNEKNGDEYLDFFSFFASSPIGLNHPKLFDKEFRGQLENAARIKPSNSDIYSVEMAKFVDTFARVAKPDYMKHLFFIDGGALAVENALKAAFDWKVRKNFQKGYKEEKGQMVIHFKEAFHGRSGYTMSLTNTDPAKINYYPKFNWPRITNPKIKFPLSDNLKYVKKAEEDAINQIYDAIKMYPDEIAALIIEPIQCEGGDNYFRKEFLQKLRDITLDKDIMYIFDEVQTGIGMTGKMWAFEHYTEPDMIAFGKKVQICGFMSSNRIDEVDDNVFHKSSRINSTWGGNLVDMVRSRKIFEIIEEDDLVNNSRIQGNYLLGQLRNLEMDFPNVISQSRGLGLLAAFDLPSRQARKSFLNKLYENKLIMLGCGDVSVRFRPSLTVTKEEIDLAIDIIRKSLGELNIQ